MAMANSPEDQSNGKSLSPAQRSSTIFWKGFSGDLGISTYDVFCTVDIVKVSFGSGHALFQSQDGDVFVCGDNAMGQLGIGTLDIKSRDQPMKVSGLKAPAIDIACGENHCAMINNEGRAFCWGDSSNGQCGVGSLDVILSPTAVVQEIQDGFCKEHGLPKPPITPLFQSISCGAHHSLAVSTDGGLWAWGCGSPLGLGEILHALVPRRVESLKDHVAIDVCCGKSHSMALVLKGDKARSASSLLTSPAKVVSKAKDIEVDKHFPSRCKSCKKEIFSYTDTNDMCIIDTVHDCGPRIVNSDDSTFVGDESLSGSGNHAEGESQPGKSTEDHRISASGDRESKTTSLNSSSSSKSPVQKREGDQGSSQLDYADSSISESQILSTSSSSVSRDIASSPGEVPIEDALAHYPSVPDMSLDGSLLCLSQETSLLEADANELSPTKSSDNGKGGSDMGEAGVLSDDAKVLFKSDNSIAVTSDDGSMTSSTQLSSSEHAGGSRGSESKPVDKTDAQFSEHADFENRSEVGDVQSSQDIRSSPQVTMDNPVYAKSISVESDDIVWKRQSDSGEGAKTSHQRPPSPSSVSVKSLNFIDQSDAMKYLQRQFEDSDLEKPETPNSSKKEKPSDTPKVKATQSSVLPYTSMVMEQVKSVTSRALTNIQSLNVFGSQSSGGNSPTLELVSVPKSGAADEINRPVNLGASANKASFSQSAMERDAMRSPDGLHDEVFSSPESCSMISSVGSLTCEGLEGGSEMKDPLVGDEMFQTKIKSGTFMEWRQEMSSIGDNGGTLSTNSNRRSLRTIEMQKRNLSSSTSEPVMQSGEGQKSLPSHQPMITTTEVWVWGHNAEGQLGVGDTIDRNQPVWLKGLSGRNVMKLVAGDSHCLALTDNSQVYTWGSNSHGQLGQNKSTDCPSRVKFPKGCMIWDVAVGAQHSLFLGDMSSGPPDVFYCGKHPNLEANAPLKKAVVPSTLAPIKEKGSIIRVFAGGTRCSCKVLNSPPALSEALFELAASERSFYGQLIKTINLLLRPLRRSAFFTSLDVFPYKSTLQNMIASFGHLTTKIGKGVTDLTATIQHDDYLQQTHFIRDRAEFIEVFRNYSRTFSDFLAVGGFEYCTKTGSEFFNEIQGNIQDLPAASKEKAPASSSLFLRAMRYPFFRLTEYSRIISRMAESVQASEEKRVYQNTVLDWDGLKLNFTSEHKLASNTKAFWEGINMRLADSLRQPSRRMLIESKSHPLTLPSAGRFASQLFVLFNDVFLHSQNNVQAMHPLVTLWVEPGMADGPQQNMLIVASPEERFEFQCPDPMLKTEWLMKFQSAISRTVKDEKTGNGFTSSGERYTPPLIRHATHKFLKAGIYKDASYNGTWLSGKIHGLGQLKWADESVYIGNFKLGLMHGQGTFTQVRGENKEIQQGTWKDGKLNGQATIIYANGDLYEGHVKDGHRQGHGMLQTGRVKSNCASIYIGEWLANMRQGYGIEDHILKGEKYMGMWSEDCRHGNGVMVTLDGMYFEGSFVHNKLLGFGVMISDDDTLYEGDFQGITHLSGKGTLTLPSGDKLEGAFSGSLNEGLKINGTFLKAANAKDCDKHQHPFRGSKSKYFGRLSIPADGKWSHVFAHSHAALCQSPPGTTTATSQQPLDLEKAWEAVAVMVSDGLKQLKKEQDSSSTKYKMQQSILQGLEKIPSRDQEKLDPSKVEAISAYLTKAFESCHHPLGQLMDSLVDVFRASYVGVGAHPILLHHAVQEVKSYVRRIYRVVRILFPILPSTDGPVPIQAAFVSQPQDFGGFGDNESDATIFTSAGLLYPVLLPKIYPTLFDLYALYNERSDDRYWERVTKLNRQGDVGLMAYLGIEQQFWLMQDILKDGTTQTLSTVKDICYAEAVDQLQQLSTAFSPVEKLKVIEQTFNQITQTVIASLGDEVMWCMDDLFPIFQFVVVRAKLHHLGAEIHLIEDLMEAHLEHGEFGLMFTTLKACYFQIQNEKMPHH